MSVHHSASFILLNMVGAVALLIWGMRMVRTGVSRAYGSGLRRVIGRSVSNRLSALGIGAMAAVALQSGTATALMVASFATRGLMETAPALAVMLGADVGSAIVAQALSFDLSWLFAIAITVGVAAHLATTDNRLKQLGRAAIGFGLMLLALRLIMGASEPLRDSPSMQVVLRAISDEYVIGALIAAALAWIAHSSLAVVLLIMSLVSFAVIPVPFALALVLGANVGEVLAPIVATLHATPQARRAPLGNGLFKLCGFIVVIPWIDAAASAMAAIEPTGMRQVVNFHLAFNAGIALLFVGLTDLMARLTERIMPDLAEPEDLGSARHLDRSCIETPTAALACAARETLRMGDIVETMLRQSQVAISNDDRKVAAQVAATDNAVDQLHEQIKLYVTEVTRESLDEEESRCATEILTFTTNLEHIGDIVENLMDIAVKKIRRQVRFSDTGLQDLSTVFQRVSDNLRLALGVFMSGDLKIARQLLAEKKRVVALEREYAEKHLARLREGRPESVETSSIHMDVLRDLKRIHSHIVSVAYPVLARAGELPTLPVTEQSHENGRDASPASAKGAVGSL